MSKGYEIRSYDYVNHPYARVRDALRERARRVPVGYESRSVPRAFDRVRTAR